MWIGKLLGSAFGATKGGLFGSFIGLVVGHFADEFFSKKVNQGLDSKAAKVLFFRATFRFMGRLAKADGRVSEHEIAGAENIMAQMGLKGEQRKRAIEYFTEGKSPNCDLEEDLRQLRSVFRDNPDLSLAFFEIQLSIAFADGHLSAAEARLFEQACDILHINKLQFNILKNRVWAAMNGTRADSNTTGPSALANAYEVLGVSPDVNNAELKKAYRKLMGQHHPDKLMAKGLPEEMMVLAKEKTQQIQQAYDLIKKSR